MGKNIDLPSKSMMKKTLFSGHPLTTQVEFAPIQVVPVGQAQIPPLQNKDVKHV